MQISKYFASIGMHIDQSSIKRVDTVLSRLEARLLRFGKVAGKPITLNITGFTVDQAKLTRTLGTALDAASPKVAFEISRFVVNDRNLLAALLRAARRLPVPPGGGPHPPLPPGGGPHPPHPGPYPPVPVPGSRASRAGVFGGFGGLYGSALTLGFGAYGLAALNKKNQQVVSAELQSTAVVQQAGGTEQQGKDSFQYLKNEGQRIGFNYLDASQDYNKLISGLTGSGVGLKESQKVFTGFAELARVNKLDKTTQNRLFRALSQVAGKGKLQSEELTGQIAEALPGGTALFAQAYQAKIGGNKTGSEAIQQLLADMKKGKVTSDILTYAGAVASQRANQGGALGKASEASQAEQARYQNAVNDMAVVASSAGVEEGFARIFRTLTQGLSESNNLVTSLAEGFNEATKWADDLLLFPQSFIRALEGKDSLVADWLGIDKSSQLVKDWGTIKQMFSDISGIHFDFLPTLEATAKEIAMILNQIAEFQKWKTNLTNSPSPDAADVSFADRPITWAYQNIGRLFNGTSDNIAAARERGRAIYEDPNSIYYHDPAGYDDQQVEMQRALDQDRLYKSRPYDDPTSPYFKDVAGYNDQQAEMAKAAADDKAMGIVTNNSNQIDITVNVDGSTMQGMDANAQAQAIGEAVANMFVQSFDQVNVQFPVKQ